MTSELCSFNLFSVSLFLHILCAGQVCIMIHSGSRGLGHQVATDALTAMEAAMTRDKLVTNDRQLACARINSPVCCSCFEFERIYSFGSRFLLDVYMSLCVLCTGFFSNTTTRFCVNLFAFVSLLIKKTLLTFHLNFPMQEGQDYLAGMAAAANYAWVNRSSMTFLVRQAFAKQFNREPDDLDMHVVYDVSHNIAKV